MTVGKTDPTDEPDLLEQVVVPAFANESVDRVTTLDNAATVKLIAGVLAQDDCAVLSLNGSQELVIGTDYIRGPKFRLYELGYLDNYDIGFYLTGANFSDIAAMGALPIALLSVIRYPKEMPRGEFEKVIEGIRAGCDRVGAQNIGGDIGSAERLILSATAIGVVEPGRALYRGGARAGDILCVTGCTGIAGAAQRYFYDLNNDGRRLPGATEDSLLRSWRQPTALIQHGRILGQSAVVTSCQDTSDGLKAAIESLASVSQVGFLVDEGDVPVAREVRAVAELRAVPELDIIFGDSVDFQLIFTISPQGFRLLQDKFAQADLAFFPIGVATAEPGIFIRRKDGISHALPGAPWRHSI